VTGHASTDISDIDIAAIAQQMLREFKGTIPDRQLLCEFGQSVAIHQRGCSKGLPAAPNQG
jgi:hypothetical protein